MSQQQRSAALAVHVTVWVAHMVYQVLIKSVSLPIGSASCETVAARILGCLTLICRAGRAGFWQTLASPGCLLATNLRRCWNRAVRCDAVVDRVGLCFQSYPVSRWNSYFVRRLSKSVSVSDFEKVQTSEL